MNKTALALLLGFSTLAGCPSPDDDPAKPPVEATTLVEDTGETTVSDPTEPTKPTEPTEPKGPIDDAALFDPDHVVDVTLTLDDADWLALRGQSRNVVETLGPGCLAEPFGSPYTMFPAEVGVDGEALGDVGVRKKGFLGSLSFDKPGLKVKTDEFVDSQLLADGTERLTLNNGVQDSSLLNQCLGYDLFRAAGMPAPRCNFATVSVNGEDLGVYVHVEVVKKDFLRRHFTSPDGDLYEGTLSDFVVGWDKTFDPKTDESDEAYGPILDVMAALDAPDDQLLDELGAVLDLPAFYRFWAMEVLVGHGDGYASNSNNFYVYRDPGTDLITFLPWGADSLFGYPDSGAVYLASWLPQRLFELPEGRAAYVAAMEDLLADTWDEDHLLAEIDRMSALIGDDVIAGPEWGDALDATRAYVRERRAFVERDLAGLVDWQLTAVVRDEFCFDDLGPVTASFSTEWATLEADVLQYSASIDVPGVPAGLMVGAGAGEDVSGLTAVSILAVTPDWSQLYQVALYVDATEPGTYRVDTGSNAGFVFALDLTDPYAEGELVGLLAGEVTFTSLSTTPGAPVVGTLDGSLVGGLFF